MIFTPNLQKAINYSAVAHANFTRVGLNLPYITHPFSVMMILSQFRQDEKILIAGLLHDVVEDNPSFTIEFLASEFGSEVADLVSQVTEKRTVFGAQGFKESWDDRKGAWLAQLTNSSEEAVLIAAADSVHNLESLLATYWQCGPQIWSQFGAPIAKKLEFYRRVELIVSSRTECTIKEMLKIARLNLENALKVSSSTLPNPGGFLRSMACNLP